MNKTEKLEELREAMLRTVELIDNVDGEIDESLLDTIIYNFSYIEEEFEDVINPVPPAPPTPVPYRPLGWNWTISQN